MKIVESELNVWAELTQRVQSHLLRASDFGRAYGLEAGQALEHIHAARADNWRLHQRLLRAGATDPAAARMEEEIRLLPPEERAEMEQAFTREVPLHLLCSPAAQRYAAAIAEAAEAARLMEIERYGDARDGLAEILGDMAESARFELHGPPGLVGLE